MGEPLIIMGMRVVVDRTIPPGEVHIVNVIPASDGLASTILDVIKIINLKDD